MIVFLPAPFGPSIAAVIMTRVLDGKRAVKPLLRSLLAWRARLRWYLFVIFAPITLVAVAVALSSFRSPAVGGFNPAGAAIAPLALVAALPFGPLPEELGWRGWALPRLLDRYGILGASLVVGVVWTFWHTPMFWFPGAAIPSFLGVSATSVALYLAQITGISLLFTVIYLGTGRSVLIAILFHLTFNTAETILFATLPDPTPHHELEVYVWAVGLTWVTALAALLTVMRSRHFP